MATELNYAVSVGAMLSDGLSAMHMTQKELAEKIGVSRSIISEIISGKRKMSLAIAIALEPIFGISPDYWMNLQNQYEIMQKKADGYLIGRGEVIQTSANSAQDIAGWFINRAAEEAENGDGDYMTNLKLQKLLYLAQKTSIKKRHAAVFSDEIRHWKFGPVVASVYDRYKDNGANPIMQAGRAHLSEEDIKLLEQVYGMYNKYSAAGLVTITHNDAAWKNTAENDVITLESMLRS